MRGFHAYRNGEWAHTLDPRVEILTRGDKILIRLLETIAYVDSRDVWHYAEKGFVCDGGSKHPIIWPVFGHPLGRYIMAYIIHDYDYWTIRNTYGGTNEQREHDRRIADRRFREGMEWIRRNSGFGRIADAWHRAKVRMKYYAVRNFAWFSMDGKRDG
jgi:hypothetical protein